MSNEANKPKENADATPMHHDTYVAISGMALVVVITSVAVALSHLALGTESAPPTDAAVIAAAAVSVIVSLSMAVVAHYRRREADR